MSRTTGQHGCRANCGWCKPHKRFARNSRQWWRRSDKRAELNRRDNLEER